MRNLKPTVKVTSADCIEFIVKHETETTASEWKRISKTKVDGMIRRDFENRRTGMQFPVYEWNGNVGGPDIKTVSSDTPSPQEDGSDFVLNACPHCLQMTNHIGDVCQKCKRANEKPVETPTAKREVTEQDCIKTLEINGPGPWVFLQKYPDQGDVIWKFAEMTTGGGWGMIADLKESEVRSWMVAFDYAKQHPSPPYVPPRELTIKDWDKIKKNPVKVDLSKARFPKKTDPEYQGRYGCDFQSRNGEWSGRIIFDRDESGDEDDEDRMFFHCGPEMTDGDLEDTLDGGVDDKLKVLFADLNINVQESENNHSVAAVSGVKHGDLWKVVRERLERSGAVKMR